MNTFLADLALAHRQVEGFAPGSLSMKNNNPGNLRYNDGLQKFYGATVGDFSFARFPSYDVGFKALEDDVRLKITGHSTHLNYDLPLTFLDYIRVYAPEEDGNNPQGYCQKLCNQLRQYNVRPATPLTLLAKLLSGELMRIADPVTVTITPEQRLENLQRALNWARGLRAIAIGHAIERIKKLFIS